MFAHRARDYSAPVNFISAGLKKGAAEEAELEDSDDEEKPVKQDDFPKDFGPKKLKTVASLLQACDLSNVLGRSCGQASAGGGLVWVSPRGGRFLRGVTWAARALCSPDARHRSGFGLCDTFYNALTARPFPHRPSKLS